MVFAAAVFLLGTIVLSVSIVYHGRAQNQPLGQGGGYEPPLCLCATPSESPSPTGFDMSNPSPTPTETPRLSITLIASPTPVPTNTQRPTSTTVQRATETPTQTATQRPTEVFATPTPEVWQGGVVPTSIDPGHVTFQVKAPAGIVSHAYQNGEWIKRGQAYGLSTAFQVNTSDNQWCLRDTRAGLDVWRVKTTEGFYVPWIDASGSSRFEYTHPDQNKVTPEDCL